jgi:hypothetical protein
MKVFGEFVDDRRLILLTFVEIEERAFHIYAFPSLQRKPLIIISRPLLQLLCALALNGGVEIFELFSRLSSFLECLQDLTSQGITLMQRRLKLVDVK